MKNSKKLYIGFAIYTILVALFAALSFVGCSENDSILTPGFNDNCAPNAQPNVPVEVKVTRGRHDGYYFTVKNNSIDTVNDFHVQFADTTVRISASTFTTGWVIDQNSTDLNHGRIGVRDGGNPPAPILQGQQARVFWIDVNHGGDYDWQATKNGNVVARGTGRL